jgi:diamine N-acetyltransferase
MPPITTRPVTQKNWRTALALDVRPDQRDFTPTVAVSLAKAYIQPDGAVYDPVAIYAGNTMVGFYSFIYIPDDLRFVYLGGFLIDKAYQGRGYGRAALYDFLNTVKRNYPKCSEVLLTVHPQNQVAQRLYQSVGFVKTGDMIDGEEVMRLVLR